MAGLARYSALSAMVLTARPVPTTAPATIQAPRLPVIERRSSVSFSLTRIRTPATAVPVRRWP